MQEEFNKWVGGENVQYCIDKIVYYSCKKRVSGDTPSHLNTHTHLQLSEFTEMYNRVRNSEIERVWMKNTENSVIQNDLEWVMAHTNRHFVTVPGMPHSNLPEHDHDVKAHPFR